MDQMKSCGQHAEPEGTSVPAEGMIEQVPAWEEIEDGRFMPRRVRGSFHGRELG